MEASVEKIKVLVLSDHPLSPSGVGTQTKYMIEACLKTGRYKFACFGGAIKHQDYRPMKTDQWGDDMIIYPVDGYGNHDMVRGMLATFKPDIVWFMTDPRFFGWLWEIENEIRAVAPMIYYHVWDNYPYPKFNKVWYKSCDQIVAISKVTHDIVKTVAPEVDSCYLPHAVNQDIFKPQDKAECKEYIAKLLPSMKDKFLFFWNNRNARRKQSGSLLFWFAEFAEKVGKENVGLIMHTNPRDPHGQDLNAIITELGLMDGTVMFSTTAVEPQILAKLYNAADCTINISDAEGFGLATLESLACGTPIIANMTGGLQEQVTDGENFFGIGLTPSSKAIIGSQDVPYIYEDRLDNKQVVEALLKIYEMSPEERQELGRLGLEHVNKNYNFEDYEKGWVDIMDKAYEKYGSYSNRKGYQSWSLKEVV
jgi:glycosyltransferase involved in cell wall biosynthesis